MPRGFKPKRRKPAKQIGLFGIPNLYESIPAELGNKVHRIAEQNGISRIQAQRLIREVANNHLTPTQLDRLLDIVTQPELQDIVSGLNRKSSRARQKFRREVIWPLVGK